MGLLDFIIDFGFVYYSLLLLVDGLHIVDVYFYFCYKVWYLCVFFDSIDVVKFNNFFYLISFIIFDSRIDKI